MLPVDPARYALYFTVMAVFAVSPGPANLFAIATGMRAGPRAALLSVAGMNVATLVWLSAAAFGLGALALAYPAYFRLLAIAGGLYVIFLGLKSLWAAKKGGALALDGVRASSPDAAFRDGFTVQLLNPKAVVFFTAVLPPFVDPARPALMQFVILGATTIVLDVIAMSLYGVAGGALAVALRDPKRQRAFAIAVGVLLCAAGALILTRP